VTSGLAHGRRKRRRFSVNKSHFDYGDFINVAPQF